MSRDYTDTPRRNLGCGGIFFAIMLVVGALWGAGLGAVVTVIEDSRPVIEKLESFRPKAGSKIYSSDGELLGEFTTEEREIVRLADIPLHVQKAFMATEDAVFYQHRGVRWDAFVTAGLDAFSKGRVRGGSGITQQVVRNVETLGVGLERSVMRKLREALVALQVERYFTKDEILELYLNQIFLGISAHGVEAASQQYFGKHCSELTIGEAATLAGLTRSPNKNNPISNIENAKSRRGQVLQQMLDNGFIKQAEHDAALKEDLAAEVVTPEKRASMRADGKSALAANRFKAPYFCEEVRRFALDQYAVEELFEEGLAINTTIDMRLQRAAESILLTALDDFDVKKLDLLKKQNREADFIPVSGGLICLDNRPGCEGFVRAMVGGRDFEKEHYNTATQARRQPGSSVKPFVWAAAVASGMTPSSIIVDAPFERRDGAGRVWQPHNFEPEYGGPMAIRHALEKSVNIVSVKLVEKVGFNVVRSYLQSCGIRTPIDDSAGLTIGLGAAEVTLINHCTAYSTFAHNGMRFDPVMVTNIANRDGLPRYDFHDSQKSERAMDPKVAYVVMHMMEGVCNGDKAVPAPTGWRTKDLARPRAGKTGTTNSSRNVWFCGLTPQYTCVVWVGYRDNRPLGHGKDFTGGHLAVPVWTQFMIEAHKGLPVEDFTVPDGVVFFNIDRVSGTAGGTYKEAYIKGTQPPGAWGGGAANAAESASSAATAAATAEQQLNAKAAGKI